MNKRVQSDRPLKGEQGRGDGLVAGPAAGDRQAKETSRPGMEIVEHMAIGVGLIRCRDGVIVYANPTLHRIFGYAPGEGIGKRLGVMFPAGEKTPHEVVEKIVDDLRRHGTWSGESLNVRKDGRKIWVHVHVSTLPHPEYGDVLLAVMEDITQRKQDEALLRLQRQIVENMAEGVGMVRCRDGRIAYTNPTFDRMFGYGPGGLVEKHVNVLLAPSDKSQEEAAKEIMATLQARGAWSGEIRSVRKDGTFFWTHTNISEFHHPELGPVWLSVRQDITERKRAEEELRQANCRLEQMAYTDPMTNLPNRRGFLEALGRELQRIRRYGGHLSVALVDVDHFKAINDTHGHLVGDRVLAEFGSRLRDGLRQADLLARFGGDEFIILLPDTPLDAAEATVDRLRPDALELPVGGPPGAVSVTFSAGVSAVQGSDEADLTDLLHWTDEALYAAKRAGRDCTRTRVLPRRALAVAATPGGR